METPALVDGLLAATEALDQGNPSTAGTRRHGEHGDTGAPPPKRVRDSDTDGMYEQVLEFRKANPLGPLDPVELIVKDAHEIVLAYPGMAAHFTLAEPFKAALDTHIKRIADAAAALGKLDVALTRLADLKTRGLVAHSIRINTPEFVSPFEDVKTTIQAEIATEFSKCLSAVHDSLIKGKRLEQVRYKKLLSDIETELGVAMRELCKASILSTFAVAGVVNIEKHLVLNYAAASLSFKTEQSRILLEEINRQQNKVLRDAEKAKAKATAEALRSTMDAEADATIRELVDQRIAARERELRKTLPKASTSKPRNERNTNPVREPPRARQEESRGAPPRRSRSPARPRTPPDQRALQGTSQRPAEMPTQRQEPRNQRPTQGTTSSSNNANNAPRRDAANTPKPNDQRRTSEGRHDAGPRNPNRPRNNNTQGGRRYFPTARWDRDNPNHPSDTRDIRSYGRDNSRSSTGGGGSARGGGSN
jgi:hypothetical protein